MLYKIKSAYITKGLFTYISENKKLELIKYNQKIQNLLDVNKINYKIYKGIEKIVQKNGKVKEYNNL